VPGSTNPQPATRPLPFGTRRRPRLGARIARRGWALLRAVGLIGFTGFLVALIVATVFAGLVIAINGRLP
jgi:hypothetical protein